MFGKVQNSISFGNLHWLAQREKTRLETQDALRDLMIINENGHTNVTIGGIKEQLERIKSMPDRDVFVKCYFSEGDEPIDSIDYYKNKKFYMEAFLKKSGTFYKMLTYSEPVYTVKDDISGFADNAEIIFEEQCDNITKRDAKAAEARKFMEDLESK